MGTPVKPNPVHADSRAAAVANGQFSAGTVRSQLSGVIDLDQSGASNNLQLIKPDPALSQYQNYYLPAGPHKKKHHGRQPPALNDTALFFILYASRS